MCMGGRFVRWLLLSAMVASVFIVLAACSPLYVVRAAYEEGKILLNRENIADVIKNPQVGEDERYKLSLVLEARDFAQTIGLSPRDTFTTYSHIDDEAVAWVVSASPPDIFQLYQWWFPIVGSVPYKGFFDKEDATDEARSLESKGYETWVRGTEAFSTLGWFNDPLLTTTLRHHPVQVVNTVLHEILHSTLWIPDHSDFNESLANFVGLRATIDFFSIRLEKCSTEDAKCAEESQQYLLLARKALVRELAVARAVEDLYSALEHLYASDTPKEEKLANRLQVHLSIVEPLQQTVGEVPALSTLNNARIMQLRLYLQKLDTFQEVFTMSQSWPSFLDQMRKVKQEAEHGQAPFDSLRTLLKKS